MMANGSKALKDDGARLVAISTHRRSILVEAGAGSGKTALMAGRIAMMLAEGVAPRNIAAVTFTELAASELVYRVREFVTDLLAGEVAAELRIALPRGMSDAQRTHLAQAATAIDEITCSTIHGFCQRLIKPYPAEADIDPGAAIIDRTQGDLAFLEIVDAWLRERLSGDRGSLIAEMVLHNTAPTVALIHRIAQGLRRRRGLRAPPASDLGPLAANFLRVVDDFATFQRGTAVSEPETEALVGRFRELIDILAAATPATPTDLVGLLVAHPSADLVTQKGTFRSYKKKGKWADAAKRAGRSKSEGERLNNDATERYVACGAAWTALQQAAASRALAVLIEDTKPILERYRDYKRGSAQLDFDDLIFAARDLLRDHDAVRRALGERFQHVLVDEFQDTDPLQTEIFWRLCGDPPAPNVHWSQFRIRPGALFLVGDPKQAIYRFRGADVMAYVEARTAFREQDGESFLSISTNFRSRASILMFVNKQFETLLSAEGQPGFTALDAFHDDPADGVCVVALDVKVADEQGEATAEQQRDAEADAVAELCARLIGHRQVVDRRSRQQRACQPGDIALLAPTGKDLWRYEEALERRGIPVATQAGKGLFRRQEIQDLIALTRALTDRRDTLGLGALLRGPLVGLTEEELLDIVWALPRLEDEPERIPRLDLGVDAALVVHPVAADVLVKLQSLYKRSNSTTPHELLSQAVDVFRVRAVLLERHRGQAERALANVDLYLSLATGYAVRGLQAFAEAMTAAWTDEERTVEGRPDAQEESVALFTMHAAKGLEWPIVIPINTMTGVLGPDSAVVDRSTDTFFCPILGIAPEGHEAVLEAERAELDRERVRLWYVAATRAREILVLPRSDVPSSKSAWNALIDLNLPGLPAIDSAQLPPAPHGTSVESPNLQTRDTFAEEAAAIASRQERLVWRAPSRNEGENGGIVAVEEADIWSDASDELTPDFRTPTDVQGGLERGLVLHKLMQEILTGEIHHDPAAVLARALELIRSLGRTPVADPATGLAPKELTGCVVRTLALPQVAALRPALQAEFPVYGIRADGDGESATAGVADALTLSAIGVPDVVVDWKSDVNPSATIIDHYRAQVRAYLDITGARAGLIVLMTTGTVLEILARPMSA
jgi:ATP-dependent exoDNAse (exonuclease V) beta subunit